MMKREIHEKTSCLTIRVRGPQLLRSFNRCLTMDFLEIELRPQTPKASMEPQGRAQITFRYRRHIYGLNGESR